MTTFDKIINKVINLDNNVFSLNYDNNDKISKINKIFFNFLYNIHLCKNVKSKFHFIEQTLDNFYFSKKPNEKKDFFDLFCKIQHIYHTLNRFVYLYKYKKTKLIVDSDLQLNKINENEPNVICIYHFNSKYLFKIEDLLKLIYTSLTNCFGFFSEPIAIKNPYNNIPFGKSILYYIYFYLVSNCKIKFIKYKYIDIFLKFKECNFNMTKFVNNYEYILREYAIINHLTNSTEETIVQEIKNLIQSFNSGISNDNKKIKISDGFPKHHLIRIMKPYLYLKLQCCYSLVTQHKNDARIKLSKKLCEFQNFNPQFGRKIIKFKDITVNGKIKRIKSHIEFNMKHKKFNTFEIENFMNNHLAYKYEENYNENELTFFITHTFNNTLLNNTVVNNESNENEQEQEQENENEYEYEYEAEYEFEEDDDNGSIS
jgi:hypothetical protein